VLHHRRHQGVRRPAGAAVAHRPSLAPSVKERWSGQQLWARSNADATG
jgi:hypothetical protein